MLLAGCDDNGSNAPIDEKLAFTSDRGAPANLVVYVMDAGGTNPVNLTNNAAEDSEPAWKP